MNEPALFTQVNSLFQQPWWLDALAPNGWIAAEVRQGGEVKARMPYVVQKRYGFTLLTMPPLTQTLGPWFSSIEGKYPQQLARQKELMSGLIDQLPKFDYFAQNFHHSITNWLPFFWSDFQQTTRYTYCIDSLTDLDAVWNDMTKDTRWSIKKAQKSVTVRADLSLDRFLDVNALTFGRKGMTLPYSRETVRRLDTACAAHNARRMFFAEDAQGNIHAAIYLVWDEQSAYYLMGGVDPAYTASGASSLLIWEAVRFAAAVTKSFDFEGSMIDSVEHFFRGFGARQKPYFRITKINSLPLKIYRSLR